MEDTQSQGEWARASLEWLSLRSEADAGIERTHLGMMKGLEREEIFGFRLDLVPVPPFTSCAPLNKFPNVYDS